MAVVCRSSLHTSQKRRPAPTLGVGANQFVTCAYALMAVRASLGAVHRGTKHPHPQRRLSPPRQRTCPSSPKVPPLERLILLNLSATGRLPPHPRTQTVRYRVSRKWRLGAAEAPSRQRPTAQTVSDASRWLLPDFASPRLNMYPTPRAVTRIRANRASRSSSPSVVKSWVMSLSGVDDGTDRRDRGEHRGADG